MQCTTKASFFVHFQTTATRTKNSKLNKNWKAHQLNHLGVTLKAVLKGVLMRYIISTRQIFFIR